MFRRCFSSCTRLGSFEKIDRSLQNLDRKIDTNFAQIMREIEESRRRSDQFQRQIAETRSKDFKAELNCNEIYFWGSAAIMSLWFSFLINKAYSSASKQSQK